MARPHTLFTGQWADIPLSELAPRIAEMGYDGLELACWGDHFDVERALSEDRYCQDRHDLLAEHGLRCWAISNHLVGQCVCDLIDSRHQQIIPARLWGNGEPEAVRQRAAEEMKQTARAARRFGVNVVNGFTGSNTWHLLYFFPPTSQEQVDAGYLDFAARWNPILDTFEEQGVRFALEVHPSEIAYDLHTARRTLDAIGGRQSFGFNFDPSHLHWQGVDSVRFIRAFPDRIFHVHVKDCTQTLDGESSILASHLSFGDPRRGWDFRSPGRGDINFEEIIRALNQIGYDGPLSVEWEDCGMDRFHGAAEAAAMLDSIDFASSIVAFDAAFED